MMKGPGSIRFGTDGWRAVIAEDFTFHNLALVADAAASYWKTNHPAGTKSRVVIGYDRRFFSERFAATAAETIAARGFEVFVSEEPLPTPALSLAVVENKAVGGVMITASHNPPRFNGFKVKTHHGSSAESDLCKGIEAELGKLSTGRHTPGRIRQIAMRKAHLERVKSLVDFKLIAGSKLRFAHEALFGVGAGCFDELLQGTTCKVTTLNGRHDPFFGGINPEPVASNYRFSREYLQKHPHDLCLVTDGDADRVGGMTGRGEPLTTHSIIALLLQHLAVNRHGKGRVVKALTTTSLIDKMCSELGLELVETGVGFKYIAAEMIRGGVLLGAEESGGIGFPGHIPERDGILAGMMLLEMLAFGKTPVEELILRLEKKYGKHRYSRSDAMYPVEKRESLMAYCRDNPPARLGKSTVEKVQSFDGVKYTAKNGSWLMLRGSGTEPILRIYAEAPSEAEAEALVKVGHSLVRKSK